MKMRSKSKWEGGLTITGFIFVAAILAVLVVIGFRVVPTVVEYTEIKNAIVVAKASGTNPPAIRESFDRQTIAGYIESVSGKDLEITRDERGFEVSVAYQKKISLGGPVSLVIDYVASTQDLSAKK